MKQSDIFLKKNKRKVSRGFTLIEALMFLFLFSVITLSFYQTWILATGHIVNVKSRLGAIAVANQQMEIIRSIIFDDIGTTTGIPTGTLAENQTLTVNNAVYNVHTLVQFVDNPTDGTLGAGTDIAPNDYKQVTVTVSWGGGTDTEKVTTTSIFSLDGVESVAAGTGILSVNVLDGTGAGVSGASVHIVNSSVAPAVNITASTDTNGNLTFPGAPASVQGYQISVSKSGYYPNTTYPPYPTSTFNPVNIHTTVVAGSLTATTLVSDADSDISFRTEDPFGTDVPDVDFDIAGGLAIGNEVSDGSPVYDYTQSLSTDGSGEENINDRSAGVYTVALDAGETTYRFLRLSPEEADFGTINLSAGTNKSVTMVLADKSFSSALITAVNSADNQPIAGASVRLTNVGIGYDTTVTTDTYGQAFFHTANTPLVAGTYDVEITAASYVTKTGTVDVAGDKLEEEQFTLVFIPG